MAKEKRERAVDELTDFITEVYKFININKATVIKNTVRKVRGNKVALRAFVQNALLTDTVLNMEMTDIELGTLLFRLLLNREITVLELTNMVEYLGGHTRADMINHILSSRDWLDRLNTLGCC